MLKYLLDTNIVIYVIKQRPLAVLDIFNRHHGRMAISSITLAELAHGAEKSSDSSRNMAVVEDFVSRLDVLAYDDKAAWQYGNIRATLEKAGQPIGLNDLHIAAHARSNGLTLVTNNLREFERVPGLLLENWVEGETK
ncbi:MAG: type II toxin-antitoxin system VapC family toxin [Gammaproteobacteria bacterium]|nr:type II toxin-antitoxin system VapC family toxin [Sideroxydans sp.]MBU3903263.1 type II toxin-antitoxin system VapC family toxin [Gammaproteobacteria bacterium]MBU4045197.1 type II toxin-antitoxin system VapC family toxin [Gammaproteobacteria bacterium]